MRSILQSLGNVMSCVAVKGGLSFLSALLFISLCRAFLSYPFFPQKRVIFKMPLLFIASST